MDYRGRALPVSMVRQTLVMTSTGTRVADLALALAQARVRVPAATLVVPRLRSPLPRPFQSTGEESSHNRESMGAHNESYGYHGSAAAAQVLSTDLPISMRQADLGADFGPDEGALGVRLGRAVDMPEVIVVNDETGQSRSGARAARARVHTPGPKVEAIHGRPALLRRRQRAPRPTLEGRVLLHPPILRRLLIHYHKMLYISRLPIPTHHVVVPHLACHLDRGRSRMMGTHPESYVVVAQ